VSEIDLHRYSIYGYLFMTGLLIIILYSYIVYLYRSEKKGERDYEKYGKLAIDDDLDSPVLEKNPKLDEKKKE